MSLRLLLAAYRYSPAIGGAEIYSRRLLAELGASVDASVVTVLTENRTSWLRSLVDGERDHDELYEIDGRQVCALARWAPPVRRRLRALTPAYHLPRSPVPGWMGRVLAPSLARLMPLAQIVHNVFMAREAFSYALLLAAGRAGLPFVFTPLRHARPLGWNSPAFRTLYRDSHAVIALTEHERRWLIAHGARPERTHVIGLGAANDPQAPLEPAMEITGGRPFVLFVGQLHGYKGWRELLEAARRLRRPETLFIFVGPDVRGHGAAFRDAPENVRYLGMVEREVRDSLLRACACLCVPSSRESFGSVLVEAWACGRPVVGGPAEATRDLIEDGVDGFLVEQEAGQIAARLAELLDDPQRAGQMGAAGRRKAQTRFSWSALAAEHLRVYRAALELT